LLRYLMGRRISGPVFNLPDTSAPYALLLILMEGFKLQRFGFRLFPGLIGEARGLSIQLMEAFQAYLKAGSTSRPFQVPPSLTQHGGEAPSGGGTSPAGDGKTSADWTPKSKPASVESSTERQDLKRM
jgi:hypothetical protein